jgi:Immunoglobulin I-set domain
VVCVGGAIGQQSGGNPNLAVDAFQGYVGAARLESGVLSATQIATNYAAGLLGAVPAVLWPPSVTPAPLNNVVYQGNTVTLGLVDRETTSFTYQWMTDNGSGGATWANAPGVSTGTNYSLNVSSLALGTYQYEIVLNNSTYSLSITSAPVELIVEAASAPTVEQQPTPASTNVYVGQSVTFTAAFTGNQPLTNQWQFSADGISYSSIAGASNGTLTLTDVQLANSGSYRLTASNPIGSGTPSAAATLTVSEPPSVGSSFTNGTLTLTWPAGGTLLQTTNLAGPWTVVSTPSPYMLTPVSGAPAQFFKVNFGQ